MHAYCFMIDLTFKVRMEVLFGPDGNFYAGSVTASNNICNTRASPLNSLCNSSITCLNCLVLEARNILQLHVNVDHNPCPGSDHDKGPILCNFCLSKTNSKDISSKPD